MLNAVIFWIWLGNTSIVMHYKINAVVSLMDCLKHLKVTHPKKWWVCWGNNFRYLSHVSWFIMIPSHHPPPPSPSLRRCPLLLYDYYMVQFLVSKLVACCVPSKAHGEQSGMGSSQVFSLLLELTVDCDPSLHDYISVAYLTRNFFFLFFMLCISVVIPFNVC